MTQWQETFGARYDGLVDRSAGDGCWPWLGGTDTSGYGVTHRNGGKAKAHRVAWERAHGPIPDGLFVLHRCDNPPCCNPAHLWLGTHGDNARDKEAKGRGRHPDGETHSCARLTAAQVAEIRARYGAEPITQERLGAEYGVSRQLVSAIVRRELWRSSG